MNHDPDAPRHRLATEAIHAGNPERTPGSPVAPSVALSSTYHWADPDDGDLLYPRLGNNPNQRVVAARVAALEGTEDALALASGMAAIAMTILSAASRGDHVVASRSLYGATHLLLKEELPRRGISAHPGRPPRRRTRGRLRRLLAPGWSCSSCPPIRRYASSTWVRLGGRRGASVPSSPPT